MGRQYHWKAEFVGHHQRAEGEVVVDVVGVDDVGAETLELLADQRQGGGVLDAAIVAEAFRVVER